MNIPTHPDKSASLSLPVSYQLAHRSFSHLFQLLIGLLVLTLFVSLTGCAAAPSADQPTVRPEPAESTSQPTPSVTAPPPVETTAPVELSAIEQSYLELLDSYRQQLPTAARGPMADEGRQQQLVDSMVSLYNLKASSRELFALYLEGILQLSPERADTLTRYAIAGLRRNSFEDYADIEDLASQAGFMDRFFAEAKRVDYKTIQFNLQPEAIQDPEIKALVLTARDKGYWIASSEGMLYYLVDFTAIARYRDVHTPAMGDLLLSLAIDNLDPMTADAAFLVDGDNLAARTYGLEKMLANAANGVAADASTTGLDSLAVNDLAVRYRDHLTLLLYGVDNTPTFAYENGQVTTQAMALFKRVATLESTQTGQYVQSFIDILSTQGQTINEQSRQAVDEQIFKKLESQYDLTQSDLEAYSQWMMGQLPVQPD